MRYWWWLLMLWALPIAAQEVTIRAEQPARVPLVIEQGERVTITALGGDTLDTTLTLLDAAGAVVAYSDDRLVAGQLVRDAQITHDQAGTYTLIVDSFNGVSEGRVQLVVERTPQARLLQLPDEQVLVLERHRPAQLQFVLDAPATLRVSATGTGQLDALVWLMPPEGTALLAGARRGQLGAEAEWRLLAGTYDLWVVDWLGRAGEVRLTLEIAP